MCKAFQDMKEKGIEEGELKMLIELVNDKMLTVSQAAGKMHLSEEQFMEKMKKAD